MQDNTKFIVDSIQSILDENNGFIAVSTLPSLMSQELLSQLGIKPKATVRILMKKLEPVLEEYFIIRSKGKTNYLLTLQDAGEFVLDVLSKDNPLTVKEIAAVLKPFTAKDVADTASDLVNSGRAHVTIDEKSTVRMFASAEGETRMNEPLPHKRTEPRREEAVKRPDVVRHEECTIEAMRKVYDELHKFREFVRICDVRRRLNWSREVFDEMIRSLRDDRTIRIMRADQSILTQDEVHDCFVDENNFIMGTMIWNGR